MNRYFLIALTSLTVCVAACTQKELLPADPFADKPWMVDPTIPVPIQLGNTDLFAVETKASDLEQVTSMDGVHFAAIQVENNLIFFRRLLVYDASGITDNQSYAKSAGERCLRFCP